MLTAVVLLNQQKCSWVWWKSVCLWSLCARHGGGVLGMSECKSGVREGRKEKEGRKEGTSRTTFCCGAADTVTVSSYLPYLDSMALCGLPVEEPITCQCSTCC